MKSFSEFLRARRSLEEGANFDRIDLSKHVRGMKAFSHGRGHEGYTYPNYEGKGDLKSIHDHAIKSGYYSKGKFPGARGGQTYVYTKGGGPYTDHDLAVHTNGEGKVWHIEHHTRVDRS